VGVAWGDRDRTGPQATPQIKKKIIYLIVINEEEN
jgi:hypothetical protein